MTAPAVVTFDVYSALVDSRRGATPAFAALARRRGWDVDAEALYDRWDARNKALQRDTVEFVPFRRLAALALADVCTALDLPVDANADSQAVLSTIGDWPLWPDAAAGVRAVAAHCRVALLTNIDDDLLAQTATRELTADAVTSQQERAYKPRPRLYQRAQERLGGPLVHVAASARDVRGALEAGLDVVRARRPGHRLDPAGPAPAVEVDDLRDLPDVLLG